MSYPQNGMKLTAFANNANGQRTDVWLQSNATHTVWAAHEHFTYDSSGRVSTVLGVSRQDRRCRGVPTTASALD